MQTTVLHLLPLPSACLPTDPLSVRRGFTLPERRLLWKAREDLTHVSSVLPKILRCVSWSVPDQRKVAESLLPRWTLLEPEHALQVRVRAHYSLLVVN